MPAGYDKAQIDALKIPATGTKAAYRANTTFAAVAAMSWEGGSPGAARAADELETGRRVVRVPIADTDANPYRIKQSGLVAIGPEDHFRMEEVAKDDDATPPGAI